MNSSLNALEAFAELAIERVVREFMNTSWSEELAERCLMGYGVLDIDMSPYERIVTHRNDTHNILTGEVRIIDTINGIQLSKGITFWPSLYESIQHAWPSISYRRKGLYSLCLFITDTETDTYTNRITF